MNRIWSYLLGVGIIEPVDDIRAGNPADEPGAARPADRRSSSRATSTCGKLITTICKSRTYQLSVATNKWNKDDEINYSHALARRLPAEVLYDAIHQATGSLSRLPGLPAGAAGGPARWIATSSCPAASSTCSASRSAKVPASASGPAAA